MGWSSDSSRSDKSGLSGFSGNGEIAEPEVPHLNGRPPTWNFPHNPHLSHLNDSYSEYSGTSVTSSPLSTVDNPDLHGISSRNGLSAANELYLASRFGGYMQQQNPYVYGPPYTGNYQGGATNFGLINDIHASANPVDIPQTQHFPVGIRFAFPRMGYRTAALPPHQAQTALSTNSLPFKSATDGMIEHHNQHETYQTENDHRDGLNTQSDETKTSYNGYVHVHYAEDDEPPLVVDDSFSSSDNEDEVVRESGIPTVIDSDDGAPSTKMWRIEPSMDSFWQYKKQIKGPAPKSYKLPVKSVSSNPHEPTRYVDPAFDRHNPVDISHFGKARIGEGNDITPNPEKLKDLGNEIEELSEKMLNLTETKAKRTQVSSKISRLKKVANHEANKIKFDGLEKEREEISLVIREATKAMSSGAKLNKSVTEHIDNLKVRTLMTQVAGRTGAYVDSLLDDQP